MMSASDYEWHNHPIYKRRQALDHAVRYAMARCFLLHEMYISEPELSAHYISPLVRHEFHRIMTGESADTATVCDGNGNEYKVRKPPGCSMST